MNLEILSRFHQVRNQTLALVEPLSVEDFVVQPTLDVSPPKWHLAHTTWFFEMFLLVPFMEGYELVDENYPLLFNSYYVSAGNRWSRSERGALTRPTVDEVLTYRNRVDQSMNDFLHGRELTSEQSHILEVGLQHEQQHQELLLYDIKYILGHNPLLPIYQPANSDLTSDSKPAKWLSIPKGNYKIGNDGEGFAFDNEHGRHEVHLEAFEISDRLVTNREYLDFINSGGYTNHRYWLSDGWDWINREGVKNPMYWLKEGQEWHQYNLTGLSLLQMDAPVSHVSYYEADAFAKWSKARLPTEFEWEIAAKMHGAIDDPKSNYVENREFSTIDTGGSDFYGNLWEWTGSAYLPYPYYKVPEGALGEYNGKFMVNQHVLRGGSFATPKSHIRATYRNFFAPQMQWLFSGIRLARHQQ
ncbi:MAG: ergothioneine biosynthesis protein EgtB [Cyclobacteriaceae bacterium]